MDPRRPARIHGPQRREPPRAPLWPGALLWIGEEAIISIECDDDHIHAIHAVVNPDKLQQVRPPLPS